jgi:hypothetical protein
MLRKMRSHPMFLVEPSKPETQFMKYGDTIHDNSVNNQFIAIAKLVAFGCMISEI